MEHSSTGVDKKMYLEMCETLGTEPNLDEIPVEFTDLYPECKDALECYNLLPSSWAESTYLGKDFTGIENVFNLLDIYDNKLEIIQMIFVIDSKVSEDISRKQKAARKK